MQKIIIHSEIYSKKNSKNIYQTKYKLGNTKLFIGSNKNVINNERKIILELNDAKNRKLWGEMTKDKQFPLKVKFFVYRATRRVFDYINIFQIVLDCMVEAAYLPDDSMLYLIPVFEGWEKDCNNPRVEFWI